MRSFQKFVAALAAVALVAAFSPAVPVGAQSFTRLSDKILDGETVGGGLTAVSTDTAIVISYVGGAAGGGEVAVAANGDITLTVNGSADTTTECPVSAPLGGVIDVSDASCNTLGEVVDAINYSANWRAAIVAGLRSDSSNDTLATIGTTTVDAAAGLALKWDTAVALRLTMALVPSETAFAFWTEPGPGPSASGAAGGGAQIYENPYRESRTALLAYSETITSTGGAANIIVSVYSVKVANRRGKINAAGTGFTGGTEDAKLLYSALGGATTVNKAFDFTSTPLFGRKGDKLLVRIVAATDLTAPTITSYGLFYQFK